MNRGGTVYLPAGTCRIATTLLVTHSQTHVVGAGGGFSTDGPLKPGSALMWTGNGGGTIMLFQSAHGWLRDASVTGVGFLSNRGLAGTGLALHRVAHSEFAGVTADAFRNKAFDFQDTRNVAVLDYSLDNEPSDSPQIGCNNGFGLSIAGSHGDTFADGSIALCNGIGIAIADSSSETFDDTNEVLVPGSPSGGYGSGIGLVFGCGAQNDAVNWISAPHAENRSVVVDGDDSCGTGKGARFDAIDLYDTRDNRGYPPVVGTNAHFTCITDTGVLCAVVGPDASARSRRVRLHCDGMTDVSARLQALLSAGDAVQLPPQICAVAKTVVISKSNAYLFGTGGSRQPNGTFVPLSYLKWTGPADGTLLQVGVGGRGPTVQGGGIDGIGLLSNGGTAAVGLDLEGVEGMSVSDFSADAFNRAAVATALSAPYKPSALNTESNSFVDYTLDNEINSGTGIQIDTPCPPRKGAGNNPGLCRARANLSYYNFFLNGRITVTGGIGIDLEASDGNFFAKTAIVEHVPSNGIWNGTGILFGCFSLSNHFQGLTASATAPLDPKRPPATIVAEGLVTEPPDGNPLDVCGNVDDYGSQALYDSIEGYEIGGPATPPLSGDATGMWCVDLRNKPCGFQPPQPQIVR
ncbi:MAG: hypothetical protein JO199_10230 [Candidatus Eremiobacteraeota bacterium]|nr:hypothetical protein [Candidatus Eremiobacteraeota bacterium]